MFLVKVFYIDGSNNIFAHKDLEFIVSYLKRNLPMKDRILEITIIRED